MSFQWPTFKRALSLGAATVVTIGARLALFGALLAVVEPSLVAARHAPSIAAAAALFGVVRTLLRGEITRAELERGWTKVVTSIRRKSVVALSAPERRDRAAQMVDAIYEVALASALVVPELVAAGVIAASVLTVAGLTLGVAWTLAGIIAGASLLAVLAPTRRALRRSRARSWASQINLGARLEGLVAAASELRAHDCEDRFSASLLEQSRALAREERFASRLGMWTSIVPATLAVVLPFVPATVLEQLASSHAATLAVLAGALLQAVLAAFGAQTMRARVVPLENAVKEFLGESEMLARGVVNPTPLDGRGSVEFRNVSVSYSGAPSTPHRLSFDASSGGTALVGANGAGKSSALLALLGLVPVAEGEIRLGAALETQPNRKAPSVAFLPQRPYVALEESVRWHLGVLGTRSVSDQEVERALRTVGLWDRLVARRRVQSFEIGDLRMGTLSGGERQRVMLARVLLSEGNLVLLDEPEAALDHEGRLLLSQILDEQSRIRTVIVVAHDETVIPPSYQRIQVGAEVRPPEHRHVAADGRGAVL